MYSQRTSYLRNAYKLFHKVGFFPLKLCKLVYYNEQMRHRFSYTAFFIKSGIVVDIIDSGFVKHSLSSSVLALNRGKCSLDLIARKVRYRSYHMRKSVKNVRHTSTLIVYYKVSHIIRTEINCK